MKNFIIGCIVFFLCSHISQVAANPDKLTAIQLVEEIKSWAAGIGKLYDRRIDFLEKEYHEYLVEAEELRKKARGYEAAGDTIQANLYKAKAVIKINVEAERILLRAISLPMDISMDSHGTEEEKIQEQAKKYFDLMDYKRKYELPLAEYEFYTLLYKAEAARYEAAGQKDLAEKYKKASEGLTEAAKLQTEANRHKTAGDEIQANLYKAKAMIVYLDVDPRFNRNNGLGEKRVKMDAKVDWYKAEAAQYNAAGLEDIAKIYIEAAELMDEAGMDLSFMRFNLVKQAELMDEAGMDLSSPIFNKEKVRRQITRAENLAKKASDMAAGRCGDTFNKESY